MIALVPNTSMVTEKAFSDEVESFPYTKSVTSMAGTLPAGIPERFLPRSVTELLHKEDYARSQIHVKSRGRVPWPTSALTRFRRL